MIGKVSSSSFLLLSILSLTVEVGAQHILDTNVLPAGIRANVLTGLLRYIIELSRQGLIDSGVANMTVPDVDWNVGSDYVEAVVHTKGVKLSGIPAFKIRTLSSRLTRTEINLEIPVIEARGNYLIQVKVLGLIPLSWSGSFNLQFAQLQLSGSGRLKAGAFGTAAGIEISNPYVAVQGVTFTFDGFPGGFNMLNIIFMILSSIIIYTVAIILLVVFSKSIKARLMRKPFVIADQSPV